jgi:protein-tyrosine-phosphatase
MRLLFVCTGNTCRSPFAEGVARAARPDLDVASAGVNAFEGQPCPEDAISVAADLGVDLSAHRSRQLNDAAVACADVIVAMSPEHARAVDVRGGGGKVRFLAPEIRDPYGLGPDEYRVRYTELEHAVMALLATLENPSSPPRVGREVHPPPAASVSGEA